MKKRYAIIGAGGHGREVMPIARAMLSKSMQCGEADIFFVVEGAPENEHINGIPTLGMERFLALSGELFFNVAIAASDVRERIAGLCEARQAKPFAVTAENVVILDSNEIGVGGIFSPFVTVTSNTRIGRYFHANMYSYVAHDCVIGDFVTFGPAVKCNGNVIIEDHAYIGSGAVIKQGSSSHPLIIGRGAVVGMGAVVTKSISAGDKVIGNPARPIKDVLNR